MSLALTGGDVLVDGRRRRIDVVIADGRIADLTELGASGPGTTVLDCRGALVAPGFIDLQCNGAGGADLTSDPERIVDVGRAIVPFGVTAFLPTVVTSRAPTRERAVTSMAARAAEGWQPGDGAVALGLHFEGPAISMQHLGAHPGRHVVVPDEAELARWVDSGAVAMVTLAPEVDGALAMVTTLAQGGVLVSAGHTAMTPGDLAAARRAGARYVTHLYNAMAPFSHRAPGPIGAVLADEAIVAGLICDGIHVDPVAVRMAWRALGPDRLSLVSDAVAPLGAPYGRFPLGGSEVVYDETGVRTPDGVLAGSALELDRAVRNLVAYAGCTLDEAIATVTSTPADLLGLADRGRIAVGHHADLTVVDADGHALATVVGGSLEWRAERWRS